MGCDEVRGDEVNGRDILLEKAEGEARMVLETAFIAPLRMAIAMGCWWMERCGAPSR